MGASVSAGNFTDDKNYELMEGGVYPARCIQVVDLGSHKNTHPSAAPDAVKKELIIIWEVSGELMQDGRPFTINKRYTMSLNEKAILRKELASWRGRQFTDDELQNFALAKILDAPCMLNITKTAGKKNKDKEYNNVLSVMPLMKGMTLAPRVNELVDFGIDDRKDEALLAKLWPWVRKVIEESYEAKGIPIPGHDTPAETKNDPPFGESDEIPF